MKGSDFMAVVLFLAVMICRILAKILAPFAVPFLSNEKRISHNIWGCEDASDLSWWNIAIRNGAHNYGNVDQVTFDTYPDPHPDPTLEQLDGFQWRFRRSHSGSYISFRCTWGKPRRSKGKKEFYIGWTMNELPKMRPVIQLRPF